MAVVRTYIQTGEPVGSRTVSRQQKDGLSPASIRNIMMELEEDGFLEQPHTSAGRVPTEKAFRFYASQCNTHQPPSKSDENLIRSYLTPSEEIAEQEMLEKTSHVLSLLSHNLGVVVRGSLATAILEHIHFVCLDDRRILVVLVSRPRQVRNHILQVDRDFSQAELEAASNYLNLHFRGWELENIRAELAAQLAEDRAEFDSVLQGLKQLYHCGMLESGPAPELFLDGAFNLIGRPELSDPGRLRELMKALEEKERVVRLLNECIRTPGEPLQVVVGLPGKPPLFKEFALIGASFSWRGGVSGRLAVIGPSRMHYSRLIRAVAYVGRLFSVEELD